MTVIIDAFKVINRRLLGKVAADTASQCNNRLRLPVGGIGMGNISASTIELVANPNFAHVMITRPSGYCMTSFMPRSAASL
jgi:hypothetical protein